VPDTDGNVKIILFFHFNLLQSYPNLPIIPQTKNPAPAAPSLQCLLLLNFKTSGFHYIILIEIQVNHFGVLIHYESLPSPMCPDHNILLNYH